MKVRHELVKHSILQADNSFGAIRYILSLSIILVHFTAITGMGGFTWLPNYDLVGGFFALSGFLIFKSYHSAASIWIFLRDRAARIMPSYLTVILSCFLLLSLVSNLGIIDYFTNPATWRYLGANLMMANFLAPELPGVFTGGEIHAVDGSLWTMKVEWCLYLSVILAAWFIIRKRYNPLKVIICIYIFSAIYRYVLYGMWEATDLTIYEILSRQFGGQLTYFYAGVLLYCYYERVHNHMAAIGLICTVAFVFCHAFQDIKEISIFITPLVFSGVILGYGLMGRWGSWCNKITNCSYEIYLFHYPVIQLVANSSLPKRVGMIGCLVATFVGTIAVSYLTARYISDPLRRRLRR